MSHPIMKKFSQLFMVALERSSYYQFINLFIANMRTFYIKIESATNTTYQSNIMVVN